MWLFHRDENIADAPPSAQKRSMISQHTLRPIHATEDLPRRVEYQEFFSILQS